MSLISNILEDNAAQAASAATEATARGFTDAPFANDPQQEEGSFFDAKDVALAPLRGIEGFAKSIYDLGDFVTGDALPNWDTRFLGKSESTVGGFVEGATQFLTGFIPVGGALGKVGQGVGILQKGAKGLEAAGMLAKASTGVQKAASIGKQVLQGAVTDFIAFDGQDERLSNLIDAYPELKNPVTDYLKANKDDNEVEGRFKNVIEGLFMEGGQQALAPLFTKGIKAMKEFKTNVDSGMLPDEAAKVANNAMKTTEGDFKTLNAPVIFAPATETPVGAGMIIEPQAPKVSVGEPIVPTDPKIDPNTLNPQKLKGGPQAIGTLASDIFANANSPKEIIDIIAKQAELPDFTKIPYESQSELRASGRSRYASLGLDPDDWDKAVASADPTQLKDVLVQQSLAANGARKAAEVLLALAKKSQGLTGDAALEAETQMLDAGIKFKDFLSAYSVYGTVGSRILLDRKIKNGGKIPTDALADLVDDGKTRIKIIDTKNTDIEAIVKDIEGINPDAPDVVVPKEGETPAARVVDTEKIAKSYEEKIAKLEGDLAVERKLAFTDVDGADYKVTVDDAGNTIPAKKVREKTVKERYLQETIASYKKMQKEHVELTKALKEFEDVRKMGPERLKELELEQKAKNDLSIKLPPSRAAEVKARTAELKKQLLSDPAAKLKELEAKKAALLEKQKLAKGKQLDELRGAQLQGVGFDSGFDNAGNPIVPKPAKVVDPEIAKLDELIAYNKGVIKENAEIETAMKELERVSKLTPDEARRQAIELKARKDLLPQKPVRNIDEIKKQINKYKQNLIAEGNQRMTADTILRREDFAKNGPKMIGSKSMQEYKNHLALISNVDDLEKRVAMTTATESATLGGKLLNATHEWFINSLFSPTTQVVNALGNVMTNVLRNLENTVGSALIGDFDYVKAHVNAFTTVQGFGEVLDSAVVAMKAGESTLNSRSSGSFSDSRVAGGAISSQAFGLDPDGTFGTVVNWIGKTARIHSTLMMGGDEIAKQVAYRQFLRKELYVEGLEKGIKDGAQLSEYVEKKLTGFVLQGGKMYNEKSLFQEYNARAKAAGLTADMGVEYDRFIAKEYEKNPFNKQKSALADAALEYAEKVTFSNATGDAFTTGVMNVLDKHPIFKFVLPFVKTPTNILKFGLSRSPLGLAKDSILLATSSKFREAFTNGTPAYKAELVGRMSVASAFTTSVMYYIMNNEGAITGGGPRNKEEKDALKSTGWQPYSIKIGDKYVSYNRLDPLATPLGIMADIMEFNKVNAPKTDDAIQNAMSGLLVTLTYNLTDKSYLRGLNNLMNCARDPETYGPKLLQDIAGGFVPNTLNQLQNTENMVIQRESRSMVDSVLRRIPIASEVLPPQRTFLGDAVYKENPLGLLSTLSPVYLSTPKNDIVDQEVGTLLHGFTMPPAKIHGLDDLDMRSFTNGNGVQAYDRFLELSGTTQIDGKNLRQALSSMMKNPEYKALPKDNIQDQIGKSSPRITLINKVVKRYRNKAQLEMLGEFPELYKKIGEITQKQNDYRLGKFEKQQ
jgi:hypothetical protein